MSLGKTLGIALAFYVLLNFVFMIVFVAVGGIINYSTMLPYSIGEFFGMMGKDTFGLIAAILSPSGCASALGGMGALISLLGGSDPMLAAMFTALLGVMGNPISAVLLYVSAITAGGSNSAMITGIVGILWVLVPGIVAAVVAGAKGAEDNSKTAFLGVLLAILIVTIIPMILNVIGQIDPLMAGHEITMYFVHPMYYIKNSATAYIYPIIYGLFSGLIFSGFAAASASNL